MEWDSILKDAVKDGKIRELYLKKIPLLKTCNDWKKVQPVGWIDHKTNLSYYKGGLVTLTGKIYYVPDRTIVALSQYINLKFRIKIEVIND